MVVPDPTEVCRKISAKGVKRPVRYIQHPLNAKNYRHPNSNNKKIGSVDQTISKDREERLNHDQSDRYDTLSRRFLPVVKRSGPGPETPRTKTRLNQSHFAPFIPPLSHVTLSVPSGGMMQSPLKCMTSLTTGKPSSLSKLATPHT